MIDPTGPYFLCASCERVASGSEWFLTAGHCPYCHAPKERQSEWLALCREHPELPPFPVSGKVFRFSPAPAAKTP